MLSLRPRALVVHRVCKGHWAQVSVLEVVYPAEPTEFIGQTILAGQPVPLAKFSSLPPTPDATGDFEEMALIAGESVGLVKQIKPAGEIVRGMMEEARQIIEHKFSGALITPGI